MIFNQSINTKIKITLYFIWNTITINCSRSVKIHIYNKSLIIIIIYIKLKNSRVSRIICLFNFKMIQKYIILIYSFNNYH